jgi:cytochrome oxidase Cu insertion factor (SCO1/SenC/PrrC family)
MNSVATAKSWKRFRRKVEGKAAWPRWLVLLLGLLALNGAPGARADNSKILPSLLQGIGIDQRLNEQVPLDLQFRDEAGKTVTLGDYFGKKPVILSLVYFGCPMLCTMAENGLLHSLQEVKFSVGNSLRF